MDEQLPKKIFPFGQRVLLGLLLIFLFLLLVFGFNFFGLYNLSEKVSFLRFLPTQEDPILREVNAIISVVKNPDLKLIAKYNIPKAQIEDEQAIILCGGFLTGRIKPPDERCTPDSLIGIKNAIKKKDLSEAKSRIKKFYSTVKNPLTSDDRVVVRYSTEEALKLDPEKQFLNFPPPPNQPGWAGSAIKQEAAMRIIKLWYLIKSKI